MSNQKLAVLVSSKGTGSNLRALLDEGFSVNLVMADREDAPGIRIAKDYKVEIKVLPYARPDEISREDFRDQYSKRIANILDEYKINVVVLAGFNRILTNPYFTTFSGLTINIHPGAIPDDKNASYQFPDGTNAPWNRSMMTDEAVTNFLGLKHATSTIHKVTEEADFGPVLKRVFVDVKKDDTVDSLYKRLKKEEHQGLIEVLKSLV